MSTYLTQNGGTKAEDLAMFLPLQRIAVRDLRLGDLVVDDPSVYCLTRIELRSDGIGLYDPLNNGSVYRADLEVTIIARSACAGDGPTRVRHAMGEAWLPHLKVVQPSYSKEARFTRALSYALRLPEHAVKDALKNAEEMVTLGAFVDTPEGKRFLLRGPDGVLDNCARAFGEDQSMCQACGGKCPDQPVRPHGKEASNG